VRKKETFWWLFLSTPLLRDWPLTMLTMLLAALSVGRSLRRNWTLEGKLENLFSLFYKTAPYLK